jgi:hypothetical protein
MKFIYLSLWIIVLWGNSIADEAFHQQSAAKQNQIADWSSFFPEFRVASVKFSH